MPDAPQSTDPAWRPWWRGWIGTAKKFYRGGPLFDLPDVTRALFWLGVTYFLIGFAGTFCRAAVAAVMFVTAAICWAAHKRARMVDWINDWAARND